MRLPQDKIDLCLIRHLGLLQCYSEEMHDEIWEILIKLAMRLLETTDRDNAMVQLICLKLRPEYNDYIERLEKAIKI